VALPLEGTENNTVKYGWVEFKLLDHYFEIYELQKKIPGSSKAVLHCTINHSFNHFKHGRYLNNN
jgi:hypothetical protein